MAAAPPDLAALHRSHISHMSAAYGRAIAAAGLDALVIGSGSIRSKSPFDDQDFPFRPTPAFAHWAPLVEPECALVIEPGSRPRLIRGAEPSYWEGPTPVESDHFWSAFEVEVKPLAAMAGALPRGKVGFIGDVAAQAASWNIEPARLNPPALVAALDAIRVRKTDYERHCMAEASRRATRGHRRAFEAFRSGDPSELELHLVYLGASEQDDAETPYKGIVALGEHAGVLHHVHYGRRPAAASDSLLIDAGATYLGYCSDITRTAARGESDAAHLFAALIRHLELAQQEICRRVRPGLAYETLHDQAHELIAPALRELGLIAASDDELVASGATRVFLPHGLGHSLGIQVHDVGCRLTPPRKENPFLRNTSIIEVGQVFTIEPGCYFIPSLLDRLREGPIAGRVAWSTIDALRPFGGVRIEDNIAVVEGGIRNLTRESWDGPS
jgi:Xaa-Pro dipeptidase